MTIIHTNAKSDAPTVASPVDAGLRDIWLSLDILQSRVSDLRQRLEPVLEPAETECAGPGKALADLRTAPVVEHLAARSERIGAISSQIDDLLHRLAV